MSYHGADDAANVDGVTASSDISSWVFQVFVGQVQHLHADGHHGVLKLHRDRRRGANVSFHVMDANVELFNCREENSFNRCIHTCGQQKQLKAPVNKFSHLGT